MTLWSHDSMVILYPKIGDKVLKIYKECLVQVLSW